MTGVQAVTRRLLVLAWLAFLFGLAAIGEASAIVKGTPSTLSPHVVRIHAGHHCSGAAIARRAVITAAHCLARRMHVVAGGVSIGVARSARSATLDDGRTVSVKGDAAILLLSSPLPASVVPVTVGEGEGEDYTIAGFGTADERYRGAFGSLREARLIAAGPYALVDPNRSGSISASACHGDSGGPVLHGSVLVGVISRAAHPHPRIACGHLTRWAPIVISATPAETTGRAAASPDGGVHLPRRHTARPRSATLTSTQRVANKPARAPLE